MREPHLLDNRCLATCVLQQYAGAARHSRKGNRLPPVVAQQLVGDLPGLHRQRFAPHVAPLDSQIGKRCVFCLS